MAYGFNEDRSKVEIYTADQIDAMDLVNNEALAQEVADRQATVTAEASNRVAGDSALDARISNIVATTGDGTIPSELSDIRLACNGTTYTTAGDSVREQALFGLDSVEFLSNEAHYKELATLQNYNMVKVNGSAIYRRDLGGVITQINPSSNPTAQSYANSCYHITAPSTGTLIVCVDWIVAGTDSNRIIRLLDDQNNNIAITAQSYTYKNKVYLAASVTEGDKVGVFVKVYDGQIIVHSYMLEEPIPAIQVKNHKKALPSTQLRLKQGVTTSTWIDWLICPEMLKKDTFSAIRVDLDCGNDVDIPYTIVARDFQNSYNKTIQNNRFGDWRILEFDKDYDYIAFDISGPWNEVDCIATISIIGLDDYINMFDNQTGLIGYIKADYHIINSYSSAINPIVLKGFKAGDICRVELNSDVSINATMICCTDTAQRIEFGNNSNAVLNYTIPLDEPVFGLYVQNGSFDTNASISFEKIGSIAHKAELSDRQGLIIPVLRNGSPGNTANANFVSGSDDIFLLSRYLTVIINDVDLPSDEYEFEICVKDTYPSAGADHYLYSETGIVQHHVAQDSVEKVRVGFSIVKKTDHNDHYPLRLNTVPIDALTISFFPFKENVNVSDLFVSSEFNKLNNIDSQCAAFSSMFISTTNADPFLFFTDPHIFPHSISEYDMRTAIGTIEYVFNNTPTDFVLCGGDWLQNQDTAAEAAYKLGRIDGIMRSKFGKNYYPILGNHDTNYQGGSDGAYPNPSVETISNDSLKLLWFREYGEMYYSFESNNKTKFYVFDTQTDWDISMSSYKWEQVDWFANNLIHEDADHSVIALHIVSNQSKADFESNPWVVSLAYNLTLIAQAYNSRTSISLNDVTYDFTNSNGKVAFMIGGHSHYDSNIIINDIPIIITINAGYTPSFDLCLADFDNGKLKMKRIGDGSDREIDIVV